MHGRVGASEQEETSRSITPKFECLRVGPAHPAVRRRAALKRAPFPKRRDIRPGCRSQTPVSSVADPQNIGMAGPCALPACTRRLTCVQIGAQLIPQGGEEDASVCWNKADDAGGEDTLLHYGQWSLRRKKKSPADLHLCGSSYALISSIATTRLLREPQDSESRQHPVV